MRDIIPANLTDRIKESFQDFGLNYDQDLKDCCIEKSPSFKSCYLMHKHVDEINKGILIACFNEDGTGFYYTHHSRMDDNKKLIEEEKEKRKNR